IAVEHPRTNNADLRMLVQYAVQRRKKGLFQPAVGIEHEHAFAVERANGAIGTRGKPGIRGRTQKPYRGKAKTQGVERGLVGRMVDDHHGRPRLVHHERRKADAEIRVAPVVDDGHTSTGTHGSGSFSGRHRPRRDILTQGRDYIAYSSDTMPIKVAFDARALVSPSRGVQRYTQELYGEIARRGVPTTAVGTDSSMTLPHGVAGVPSPFDPQSNLAWCAWGLPAAARRAPFDVFHAPAYTAPLFGVHPVVVTLHDISYEAAPAWYPYKRDRIRRAFYRHSAARARAIITDATATRDAIVEHYGGPRARIH